jgi:hypothetical protein
MINMKSQKTRIADCNSAKSAGISKASPFLAQQTTMVPAGPRKFLRCKFIGLNPREDAQGVDRLRDYVQKNPATSVKG